MGSNERILKKGVEEIARASVSRNVKKVLKGCLIRIKNENTTRDFRNDHETLPRRSQDGKPLSRGRKRIKHREEKKGSGRRSRAKGEGTGI